MESTWDGTRARQSRSRTPRVAGLPSNRCRPGFSLELGRAVITRQPLLRSESLIGNPRPSRTVFVVRTTLQVSTECIPVGLLTLMIACALTVEPESPPSGPGPEGDACADLRAIGRPTVVVLSAGERPPRSLQACRMTIREARTARSEVGRVRVGLSGLSTDPRSLTAAMLFAPCPNIAFAARQIAQLSDRCRTLACFKAGPIYCAIAAYHGSWERPPPCSLTPSGRPSQRVTHRTSACRRTPISIPAIR
jgi:hypothetical protein